MKQPIAWHRNCLENRRAHDARLKEQIERLQADYQRGQKEINEYDAQILRAELKGVTEFDRYKFGKTRSVASRKASD